MLELIQRRFPLRIALLSLIAAFLLTAGSIAANEPAATLDRPFDDTSTLSAGRQRASAARGYELLRTKRYLPADFDEQVFDSLWTVWPEPLRSRAATATSQQRRRMAFTRYGMMEPPERDSAQGPALGYVDDGRGGWVMNCLSCHAGKVAGRVILGAPNTHLALGTLTEEVRVVKLSLGKQLTHLDLGSLRMPLGTTVGTTNSVNFGIALGALRDADLNVSYFRPAPRLIHHDMDAPALWNVRKKDSLYADGFAPKNHRVLMQFIFLPRNGPERIKGWEDDFRHVLAWIESLEPPDYPWEIDPKLAAEGEVHFRNHCSRCHGTYGDDESYVQQTVPLDEVGTDPVRLRALLKEHRQWTRDGWMGHYGRDPVDVEPAGYVAPPLDGVWATAPYLHNGSVPTLWHVLHPHGRPLIWKRSEDGYDREKVGLEVTIYDELPATELDAAERRHYFDTRRHGKNAAGHRFPDVLTEPEKRAVLEYLKTL